jgi:hypothetical protein
MFLLQGEHGDENTLTELQSTTHITLDMIRSELRSNPFT